VKVGAPHFFKVKDVVCFGVKQKGCDHGVSESGRKINGGELEHSI
jgi:hypothetical protein